MKLPKKIKILNRDYAVRDYCSKKSATDGNYGVCDNNDALIQVDLKWSNQTIATTLLHEILHAVSHAMALEAADFKSDEDMVHPMSNGLATVMRDNPKVFQDILKALK